MIRSIRLDFESDETVEIEDGGRVESKLLTTDEFDGLHEAGYFRMSKGFQFKAHRHKGWLLVTILKGRMEVKTLGHETEIFEIGDTYLVEPKQCHTETALEDGTVVFVATHVPDVALDKYPVHTVEV